MRRLRHRLLQRLIAACLVAGVGAGLVPAAQAAPAHEASRGLDQAAVSAARQSARQAPTRDAAIDTFVAVYVRVSGDGHAAEALYDALRGDAMGCVPPPAPPVAVASAAPTGVPPLLGAAVLPAAVRAERLQAVPSVRPEAALVAAPAPARRSFGARAP